MYLLKMLKMTVQRYLVLMTMMMCVKGGVSSTLKYQENSAPVLRQNIAQQGGHTRTDNSLAIGSAQFKNSRQNITKVPKAKDDLYNTLKSVVHNPDMLTLLMGSSGDKNVDFIHDVLKTVVNSVDEDAISLQSILSILEFILAKVQYFLSPEARDSPDQCIADVSAYIQGVEKFHMWALQMLDASAKPGKSILQGAIRFLGNYDECLEVTHTVTNSSTGSSHVINGGYCHFYFTVPVSLLNSTNGRNPIPIGALHSTIQYDLCLPTSCNDSQVSHAAALLPLNGTGISLQSAQFSKVSNWKEDPVAIATVVVLCFLVSLTLIGTLYDIISAEIEHYRRKRSEKDDDNEVDYEVNNTEVLVTDEIKFSRTIGGAGPGLERIDLPGSNTQEQIKEAGFGRQLLLSFSISKNTEKILNTRTGESNLGCIHGIRVLSMAWVILGHSVSWDGLTTYENVLQYSEWIRKFTMQFLVTADLAVDTFFLMSGVLVTFLFLRECEKSPRGRPTVRQMIIYYVHRWWRLTPVYMVIVMVYTGLVGHFITGPLADIRNQIDKDQCRVHWWTNILYINNLYKVMEMCLPASWFLANDMQFYVVAPLALLPIAFGLSWLGYIVISAFIATHIVSYGYLEWQTGGSYLLLNTSEYFEKIYRIPWCRIGVFAIGMFLGVILQKTKCKLKIRRHLLLLGWQLFLGIGILCTYITYDHLGYGKADWDLNTRIIFNTLHRPGWGLFVSWIILVCCTGNGGFINTILSWSAWIPLGRLTYGAYLIHTVLLDYTEFSVRSIRYADIVFVSYHYIGTFVFSYALSFITCILVESPCMALERTVLKKLNVKR